MEGTTGGSGGVGGQDDRKGPGYTAESPGVLPTTPTHTPLDPTGLVPVPR